MLEDDNSSSLDDITGSASALAGVVMSGVSSAVLLLVVASVSVLARAVVVVGAMGVVVASV